MKMRVSSLVTQQKFQCFRARLGFGQVNLPQGRCILDDLHHLRFVLLTDELAKVKQNIFAVWNRCASQVTSQLMVKISEWIHRKFFFSSSRCRRFEFLRQCLILVRL